MGGRIVARRGQQVTPTDIVAEALVRPEHLILDIGKGLGLSPKDADHYIQHRAGDEVMEGDVLAGPVGIGRRVVRAPKPGIVVLAGEGQVLMELEGEYTEVRAGYTGVVAEILGTQGVVIDALGSLIQGVWGNGRINYGMLNILADQPDDLLVSEMMDVSLRGSVIMGCHCEDEGVLTRAEELPIRGMILSSMDSTLVPAAMKVSYPIVLVEGFGNLSMNMDAFNLLISGAMREVSVNAEPWDRIANTRPEVVITLPEGVRPETPADAASFNIGQTVRAVSRPYSGMVGTLTTLQNGLSVLPGGLRAQTAGVRLTNGDIVQIPLVNLEIIG